MVSPIGLRQTFLRGGAIVILLMLALIYFGTQSSQFLTIDNLLLIGQLAGVIGIFGFGITLTLIAAEIDLSIAGNAAFAGVVMALAMSYGWAWPLALATGLCAGTLVGLVNGLATVRLMRVFDVFPSFLPTLAMMFILRGLAHEMQPGYRSVTLESQQFQTVFGTGEIGPVPTPLIFMLAVGVGCFLVLRYTAFGRRVFAVGANAAGARLCGISPQQTKLLALVTCGLLASVAGAVNLGYLGMADAQVLDGVELKVIAAVAIGGTALFGGRGSMIGTFLGAIFMGVMDNGMTLTEVNPGMRQIVTGCVLVAAVSFDTWGRIFTRRYALSAS